jgi:WD40 repeat protein
MFYHRTLENFNNKEEKQRILSISFHPNNKILASGCYNNSIEIWNIDEQKLIGILNGHTTWVISVEFNENGYLASGCGDGSIKIWNIQTMKCIGTINGWDIDTEEGNPDGHIGWVRSVTFVNYHILASTGNDTTIKLWDLNNMECIGTMRGHIGQITSIKYDHYNNFLVSGSADRTIKLWNINNMECIGTLNGSSDDPEKHNPDGHTSPILTVALNGRGILASGSNDNTIKIWDLRTMECIRTIRGHTDWIRSVSFNNEGSILISACDDKTIKLWDIETGVCITTLVGHSDYVMSVVFNNDGIIASASNDKTIKLWKQPYTKDFILTALKSMNKQGLISDVRDEIMSKLWVLSENYTYNKD